MADNEQILEENKEPEQKKPKLEEQKSEEPEGMISDSGSESDEYEDPKERQSDLQKYNDQIEASGGFAVDFFPKLRYFGLIVPVSDYPERDEQLKELSNYALESYNAEHGTNYGLSKVVNGTCQGAGGFYYFLTFHAKEPADRGDKTFRAEVFEGFPSTNRKYVSCQIYAEDSSKATT